MAGNGGNVGMKSGTANLPRAIRAAIDALVQTARPQCVILFGSYANGQQKAGSDLDLIFIVRRGPSRNVAVELRKKWRAMQRETPELPPIDILVYTPDEFRDNLVVGFVPYEALREGIVVYGEPPAVGEAMVGEGR